MPWLEWLVAGLSPRRPGFAARSVHVGFVVDKVALGQVFLRVLRFSPVSIFYHCSIPVYHRPMRCATALTEQRIVLPSVLS
jgi:branched-subunit amino acid transport protein